MAYTVKKLAKISGISIRTLRFNDIQRIISSDDFNKIDALMSHKQVLVGCLDRTKKLRRTKCPVF